MRNTLQLVISLLVRGEKRIVIEDGQVVVPKISREAKGRTYSKVIVDDPVDPAKKRGRFEIMKKLVESGKIKFPLRDNTKFIEELRESTRRLCWIMEESPVVRVDKALPGDGVGTLMIGDQVITIKTIE